MTMENQVISTAASQQQLERRGLVVRVEGEKLKTTPVFGFILTNHVFLMHEELTERLQHSLNDLDTSKRDREGEALVFERFFYPVFANEISLVPFFKI